MVSDVTGHLREDHLTLKRALDVLDVLYVRVAQAPADPGIRSLCEELLQWLKAYALCHHEKEELHLFPLLAARSLPKSVDDLLVEHAHGEMGFRAIEDGLEGLPRHAGRFASSVESFLAVYRNHIHKEDTFLLPVISGLLRREEDRIVLLAFKGLERRHFGEAGRDGYHHRLREIAARLI